MTIRPIIGPNNPILRKRAIRVTSFDKKFQTLVDDMVETLLDAPGVGLAAPQVAVSQRLIIVRLMDDDESREQFGEDAGKLYVVVNPEIIKTSKERVEGVEGCLSIPGYVGTVDRYETVVITGQDRYGKSFRKKASGWLARVFQHEIDHLDGRLYIDIAKEVWEVTEEDETPAE
ncbi:MAG: peptide deformylase [Anaerolineae bacterium]|nr:peptide deformylase [Anaerolineae bacterium]